jgi:hypothetical protein
MPKIKNASITIMEKYYKDNYVIIYKGHIHSIKGALIKGKIYPAIDLT